MTGRLNSLWLRLFVGYAIPLLLFLSAALVAYLTIQRLLGALDREQHAQQVLTRAYKLKETIASMAAYKSTHHLLGDPAFQELYEQRRRDVLRELAGLRDLVQDEPERVAALDSLAALEREWYALAQKDFELFDKHEPLPEGKLGKWFTQLQLRPGVRLFDTIRQQTDGIVDAEHSRLEVLRREAHDATAEGVWAITGTTALAVLLSLVVSLWTARGVTQPINELRSASGRLRKGEFTVLTPSGPTEIAELTRSFNLMGVALTEREALLQTSERRYRTVVGSTSALLWTTDARGRNTEMSHWCAFTGQSEQEAHADGWLAAVHPEDREAFAGHWAEAVAGPTYAEDEIRIRRHDGCYRSFLCRSVPVLDARGQVLEWVRCCADVTERRQEEALRKDKETAEAANRAKSEFLAKMSHELRTPLNAVIGMSKMLSTQRFGPLNAKQADYLTDITSAGEHLLTLINDILDLSKVEAGRMDLFPEPVPVVATLDLVLSTVRPLADAKGLKLTRTAPEPDGMMIADLARFKQILFNLLSNAVKFTPAGGRVTLRGQWVDRVGPQARVVAAADAKAARFEVEDTGVGIDPRDQQMIGSEFYQARRSRSQAVEGTGLGLALTQRLAALMGGTFWFRSTPGEGSCFSFALPLRAAGQAARAAPAPALAAAEEASASRGRPLALVIEDHIPTNKLLTDWLLEAGLEVESAFSGPEGVEQAQRLRPRLILLDIRLPGMDGWQVLSELKGRPETASIPVVVVSVMDGQHLPREVDIADWLVKPVDKEQFLQGLRAACPTLFTPGRPLTALLVDDEPRTRKWLRDMLAAEGLTVIEAGSGAEALTLLPEARPDLVLLDLLMPETDGFDFVEGVRADRCWQHLPILVVTAQDVTGEDWKRLHGRIQAVLAKDVLTREKLLDRLRRIGFTLPEPRPEGGAPA